MENKKTNATPETADETAKTETIIDVVKANNDFKNTCIATVENASGQLLQAITPEKINTEYQARIAVQSVRLTDEKTKLAVCRILAKAKEKGFWNSVNDSLKKKIGFNTWAQGVCGVGKSTINNYVRIGELVLDDGKTDILPKKAEKEIASGVKSSVDYSGYNYCYTALVEIVNATGGKLETMETLCKTGVISPIMSIVELKKALKDWKDEKDGVKVQETTETPDGETTETTDGETTETPDESKPESKTEKVKKVELSLANAKALHTFVIGMKMGMAENQTLSPEMEKALAELYGAINKAVKA